jgi:hypothetical protein
MKCSHCEADKSIDKFQVIVRHRQVIRKRCLECRAAGKIYYEKNKKRMIAQAVALQTAKRPQRRAYLIKYRNDRRADVLTKLGGVCVRCGFSDERALQIDHVNGDGHVELRRGVMTTHSYHMRVLSDVEGRYQLLCANCNWIKRAENGEHLPRL